MKLLDTNVLAKWGNPAKQEEVVPYLQRNAEADFVTSSLAVFEFFRPEKRQTNSEQVRTWLGKAVDSIEPFSESAGLRAATVEQKLRQQGIELDMRDLLIASHARELDATFVTYDKGDFADPVVQQLLDVDVIE
ncbi:type II toxin-antitoxin system VapC family toxin [Halovenus sp. HT40]|uniref:type II toxin-antitoxin system VapC family toxin n=1 Tax=Halovenus sp. HT40 TaxID=3126691 RepID=UPI00300EAE68